ncbi:hypothetical protein [Entomomonas asaccharolytica]|uniref:Uncharacterized protein n=1 Tax=Entomomonas asaccharolytica TaxID=2785331 RepID=A0A974NFJ8_9GAMM|nr:hypothetical protein [Entomomonas asaccharolytica]QQP85645.1 hypothetical protein JHT90_14955 [Entomomonas asaccharolytica]
MSLTDIISQYTKLAGQHASNNEADGGLLGMAKSLLGNEVSGNLIQKFLSNLSPDIIQKLSALKALGSNETSNPESSENFVAMFKQLAGQFATKDTDQQVSELAEPDNANLVAKALDMAKGFGINLDKLL